MKALAVALASLVLATPVAPSADYRAARRAADGGVSEPGGQADASLTARTILAVRAAGRDPGRAAREYVRRVEELSGVPVSVVSVGPAREQSLPIGS